MMRRPRSSLSPGIVTILFLDAAVALLVVYNSAWGSNTDSSADAVNMPDSTGFSLARSFLSERSGKCGALPGSIVPSLGKKGCIHPLDRYVFYRNDSLVILNGGKATLAAYERFRSVRTNGRRPFFSFREFLPYTELPKPPEDPWVVRQLNKILNWTFGQFFRYIAPRLAELWNNLSGAGKTTALVIGSLLGLFFLVLLARALVHSQAVQQRLSASPWQGMPVVRKVDWLAEADARIRTGDCRGALSALYSWFIGWITDRGIIRRQEWWTNRQLIAALKRTRPAICSLAQSLISAYEDSEYGHRPTDAAMVNELRGRAGSERSGVRP